MPAAKGVIIYATAPECAMIFRIAMLGGEDDERARGYYGAA